MIIKVVSILVIAALCFTGFAGGWQAPEPEAGSAEAALTRALDEAGLTADQVSDLRIDYEIDDGKPEYDVEFRDGDWEYEYTVDAETGKILEADKDYEPPAVTAPAEKPPVAEPAPEAPAAKQLSADEAKAVALAHSGLAEGDATRLRAEFDMDDGIAEWEIEFNCGSWEYEYEINADTGAILSWERDDD
ncbi:MAG: PepSY domain-containing protein [Oscillospiraceae bacterium]|nr:PepSY domain-containing protein [Oscillospiraceae bacterium]